MTLDNQVGDYRMDAFDLCGVSDFPYGICPTDLSLDEEFDLCIGVVRAAIKKAKANL